MFMGKIKLVIVILIVVGGVYLYPVIAEVVNFRKTSNAAGALPYQVGITNAVLIPCVGLVVCPSPMCNAKHTGSCPPSVPAFFEVTGMSAGGTGMPDIVLSSMVVAKIGLTPGGQVIAGGLGPTLMDGGVAASLGGAAMGLNQTLDRGLAFYGNLKNRLLAILN